MSITKSIPLVVDKINKSVHVIAEGLKVEVNNEKALPVEVISDMISELKGKLYQLHQINNDGALIGGSVDHLKVTDI